MAGKILTAERLREILHYDQDTGVFTWRVRAARRIHVGSLAGSTSTCGYRYIQIDGISHREHRLAWLYFYGNWPTYGIDHISGVTTDNRISNLRESTQSQNMQNRRKANTNNKSGLLGVHASGERWAAQIKLSGKVKYLGSFDTPELAHAAYLEAKASIHPFQTLLTRP